LKKFLKVILFLLLIVLTYTFYELEIKYFGKFRDQYLNYYLIIITSIILIFFLLTLSKKKITNTEGRNKPTWLLPKPFLNLDIKIRLSYERLREKNDI
tara:strand:+ start:373 stop:666 length:294 start_codon:yes stop_codon:yes gene_type:complete